MNNTTSSDDSKSDSKKEKAEALLRESEKNLHEKITELSLLSKITSTFLELESKDDIYNFLGEKIHQLSGADYLMISEYLEHSQSVKVRKVYGITNVVEKTLKLLNVDLMQVRITVEDLNQQRPVLSRQKLIRIDNGLYGLTTGKISKSVSKSIETLLGINEIFSTGFVWKEKYFGGLTLSFKKGNQLKNPELIQSVIDQAAMALGRKYAEEALIISEERFRTIFNESPIGIELYDTAGKQTNANKASLNMFGITDVSEILKFNIFDGTSLDAVNKEKLLKGESVTYQATFDFGKVKALQQYKTMKNGIAHFDYSVTPLLETESKSIQGYLLQVQDITKRKQAEEDLRTSEGKYRMLFESNPHPMWVYDLETFAFLAVNDAAEKKYGYSRDEFYNMTIKDIRPDEDVPRLLENVSSVKEGLDEGGHWRHRKKDGTVIDVEIISHTLLFEGRQAKLVLAHDITKRKQTENELLKAKEHAEESDRLKSAFLTNISHEIRTPLNGIMGFAELLKEPDLTGEEQQAYLAIIAQSSTRMLNIITDIVDLSKIESNQVKISLSETNVNEQIENICGRFKPEAEKKRLQFHFRNTLPKNEAVIRTDPQKLNRILSTLVKNAIKFTHSGSIEIGYELVEKRHALSLLQFYVKDTGIGIRPDQMEFIFERFRQGSESLNKSYEGAGLGLTISKAFVEMLGGKISVESEQGKGSTFFFTLPDIKASEAKHMVDNNMRDGSPANALNYLKILVAEDDLGSAKLLSVILGNFSKEILFAKNGIEAVETCRANPDIDLVFMDIQMPEMDGYEATRQIRQYNGDVVIFAQTAYALAGDNEKALKAGCNDYISKPIRREVLIGLIQKYFKR